jgi:RNA polymerase sigma factor (sigma-70 family)
MLFKLQYTPASSPYIRAFTMLAPLVDNTLDASRALYAGHFAAAPSGDDGFLSIKNPVEGIASYESREGILYSGLHQDINLYPKGSAFSGNQWALAVLIPNQDLAIKFIRQNRPIQILLLALFIFGVGAAALLSRRHVAPVVDALRKVKTGKVTHHKKTNIQEIDDLMAFLATQDESDALVVQTEEMAQISPLVQSFVKNVKTLSPAERSVFDLYLQGYTAKEITEKLCISINTIKTHNKRIYNKLNVSSRKELLLYVKMIQERKDKTADDAN